MGGVTLPELPEMSGAYQSGTEIMKVENTAEITENTKREETKVSHEDAEARRNKAKVVFRSADL